MEQFHNNPQDREHVNVTTIFEFFNLKLQINKTVRFNKARVRDNPMQSTNAMQANFVVTLVFIGRRRTSGCILCPSRFQ